MSYILEALKKSEQQRQQQLPDNGSNTSHWLTVEEKKTSSLIPALLVALLFMILGLGIYWVFQNAMSTEQQEPANQSNQTVDTPAPVVMTEKTIQPAAKPEVASSTSASAISDKQKPLEQRQQEARSPIKTPQPEVNDNKVKPEREVVRSERVLPPLESLKKIPDLIITGHIYSTEASKRSVSMNGRDWSEGDYIAPNVTLSEITSEGIIILVDGRELTIKRNRGWKAIQ